MKRRRIKENRQSWRLRNRRRNGVRKINGMMSRKRRATLLYLCLLTPLVRGQHVKRLYRVQMRLKEQKLQMW